MVWARFSRAWTFLPAVAVMNAIGRKSRFGNVARCARHLADDHTLALGEAIDERALARVAPADGGQLHRRFLRRFEAIGRRQALEDEVEQMVLAAVLLGADAQELAAAELVELGG